MKSIERGDGRPWPSRLTSILVFATCLLVGSLVSVHMGADFNWDLQNYHLYNPFAFLTGRIGRDLMAAGPQSYLNPLLDIPFFLSWTTWFHARPWVTAFLAGLPYGVAIFLTLCIATSIFSSEGERRPLEVVVAAVIGATGTVSVSEVGTTFNDISIAVLILGALLVDLRRLGLKPVSGFAGGVLLGIAAGLKMTAFIFAPGYALAVMSSRSNWRAAITGALWVSSGWLLGYLAAGGWWAWKLYGLFGNPIFPMFNHAFHSTWLIDHGRDLRFMPHGVLQTLFYPFYWMAGERHVTEVPMRDPRFALAYVSSVVVAFGLWRSSLASAKRRSVDAPPAQRKRALFLLVFVAVSFVIWQIMFSIARYMVALELLTGVLIVLAIQWLCQSAMTQPTAQRATTVVAALVAMCASAVSLPMDWGRIQFQYVPPLVDSRITLPDQATVLVVGSPIAFVLTFIRSADSSFISIDGNSGSLPKDSPAAQFIQMKLSRLRGANNWVLTNGAIGAADNLVGPYGLRVYEQSCRTIRQSPQPNIQLCALVRSVP